MNIKIVRICIGTSYACVQGYRKMYFEVNIITRRDDNNDRRNEAPLFYAEENTGCNFCSSYKLFQIVIELLKNYFVKVK